MDKVYKYRDLKNEHTIKMLTDFELYFNTPNKFNDPFDSYVEHDITATPEEWHAYFQSQGCHPDLIARTLDGLKSGEILPNSFIPRDPQFSNVLRIFCFCKEPNNMLLWSHYAKDHTGICIGFKVHHLKDSPYVYVKLSHKDVLAFDSTPHGLIPLVEVNYRSKMPRPFNRVREDISRLVDFIKTKSRHWKYEKEYRAIITESYIINNPVHFDPTYISDIIFGINTDKADIQMVRDIISTYPSSGNWINLLKCERKTGKYKIKLVPI